MKKGIYLSILVLISFFLFACNNGSKMKPIGTEENTNTGMPSPVVIDQGFILKSVVDEKKNKL